MFRWRRNADAPPKHDGPGLAEILGDLSSQAPRRLLPEGWAEEERPMFEAGLRRHGTHFFHDRAGVLYTQDGDRIDPGSVEEIHAKILCGDPVSRTEIAVLGWRVTQEDSDKDGVGFRAVQDARGATQCATSEERLLAKIASWEKHNLERVGNNARDGDA
jgi:hypothetical protein